MPFYDYRCDVCGTVINELRSISKRDESSTCCDRPMTRVLLPGRTGIVTDEIPGGQWIENLGPEPVYVTSHSQRLAIAKARGLREPTKADLPNSTHVTDWGTVDAYTLENARILVERQQTHGRGVESVDADTPVHFVNETIYLPVE